VFFRKKGKYTDVEGYNRISKLIEDRQRDMAHDVEDDEFDDDAVLLSREPVSRERVTPRLEEESVGPVRPANPAPPERSAPVPAPAVAEERRIPFQVNPPPASNAPAPAPLPPVPEAPAMVVPEMGSPHVQGSFVAAEAVWEGKLVTNGNVRVEGTLHGEIQTSATIFVAANAHLDGVVRAGSIVVAGEVEGQVQCSERLEVLPGGSARGEIETATLVVHEGAFIDSRFQMRKTGASLAG
jgi:cytoskeletal protein CcmA (bactofilin family)